MRGEMVWDPSFYVVVASLALSNHGCCWLGTSNLNFLRTNSPKRWISITLFIGFRFLLVASPLTTRIWRAMNKVSRKQSMMLLARWLWVHYKSLKVSIVSIVSCVRSGKSWCQGAIECYSYPRGDGSKDSLVLMGLLVMVGMMLQWRMWLGGALSENFVHEQGSSQHCERYQHKFKMLPSFINTWQSWKSK